MSESKTFHIYMRGENEWHQNPRTYTGTLLGAKQYATKHCLEWPMTTTICEVREDGSEHAICQRIFWRNLSRFGWHDWSNCEW